MVMNTLKCTVCIHKHIVVVYANARMYMYTCVYTVCILSICICGAAAAKEQNQRAVLVFLHIGAHARIHICIYALTCTHGKTFLCTNIYACLCSSPWLVHVICVYEHTCIYSLYIHMYSMYLLW